MHGNATCDLSEADAVGRGARSLPRAGCTVDATAGAPASTVAARDGVAVRRNTARPPQQRRTPALTAPFAQETVFVSGALRSGFHFPLNGDDSALAYFQADLSSQRSSSPETHLRQARTGESTQASPSTPNSLHQGFMKSS